MAGELNDLSVAIGGLRADVKNLSRIVYDNQQASTDQHRKVHDIVVATSEAMRNLAAKVSVMEPLTKDYELKRAERRGATRLMNIIYVTFGSIGGAVVTQLLPFLTGKPPHP